MDDSQIHIPQQKTISLMSDSTVTQPNLDHWIFDRFKPFLTGRMLEIAKDNGCIMPVCKQKDISVEVLPINLLNTQFETSYVDFLQAFDALIVIENEAQIVSKPLIIANCTKLLKQKGHLLIHLPAPFALYNGLDQGIEVWKNNNQKFIDKLLRREYKIIKTRYFIVGDEQLLGPRSVSKYNERVALFSTGQAKNFIPNGLSIIVAGRKR